MKSRQRFFDLTVLRKDLTRFCPLWIIYIICGLLLSMTLLGNSSYTGGINVMNSAGVALTYVNLVYGIFVAQLLFGDLFNNRLCNALHAMPVRREGWFATHVVSGLLYSLGPNLLVALVCIPYLGSFWYIAFLWLGAVTMQYLFFFGLGVLSVFLTGNRFAAISVYTLVNFLSILAMWFLQVVYEPLIYGVRVPTQWARLLCPAAYLADGRYYFSANHLATCPCRDDYFVSSDLVRHQYAITYGTAWGYVAVLAAVGLAFMVLALVLYRKRKLESAGDFMAFKATNPVLWVLLALVCGAFLNIFATELMGEGDLVGTVFMTIGLVIGFFAGQMLVMRTVKVFRKKVLLQLVVMFVVMVASLGLTKLDPLGIGRYIPDFQQVETALVISGTWNDQVLDDQFFAHYSGEKIYTNDPVYVRKVMQLHQQAIQEGDGEDMPVYADGGYYGVRAQTYTIQYKLKSGKVVTRLYRLWIQGDANEQCQKLLGSTEGSFSMTDREQFFACNPAINYNGSVLSGIQRTQLLEALWADGEKGLLSTQHFYHRFRHNENSAAYSLNLKLYDQDTSRTYQVYLEIYPCMEQTYGWLKNHTASIGTNQNPEELAKKLDYVVCDMGLWQDVGQYPVFAQMLMDDYRLGLVDHSKSEDQKLFQLTLHMLDGSMETFTVLDYSYSAVYQFLVKNFDADEFQPTPD